jgi:hypothetical protein
LLPEVVVDQVKTDLGQLPQVPEVLVLSAIHHGDMEVEMVMDVPRVLLAVVLVVLHLLMEPVEQEEACPVVVQPQVQVVV